MLKTRLYSVLKPLFEAKNDVIRIIGFYHQNTSFTPLTLLAQIFPIEEF